MTTAAPLYNGITLFQLQRFEVKPEHITLLKRLSMQWYAPDETDIGVPGISWSRPYGNSDIYGDIAEVLGLSLDDDEGQEEYPPEDLEQIERIHREMSVILQIVVQCGQITPGVYVREQALTGTWRRQETILRACKVNDRGLKGFFFADRSGHAGFLNKSSAAEEPCIWLGLEEQDGSLHALHLNLELVRELLPHLQRFAETEEGDLS